MNEPRWYASDQFKIAIAAGLCATLLTGLFFRYVLRDSTISVPVGSQSKVLLPPSTTLTAVPPTTAVTTATVALTTTSSVALAPTTTILGTSAGLPYVADWSSGLIKSGWNADPSWNASGNALMNSGSSNHQTMTAMAPVTLMGISSYVVEADIQYSGVGDEQSARFSGTSSFGIVVKANANTEGYGGGICQTGAFYCNTYTTQAVIWGVNDGRNAKAASDFVTGDSPHHFRFEVRGDTLRLLVDATLVGPVTDTRYGGSQVGLWSDGAQIIVRNFRISALA
jgi:hypothetical protein